MARKVLAQFGVPNAPAIELALVRVNEHSVENIVTYEVHWKDEAHDDLIHLASFEDATTYFMARLETLIREENER